MKQKLSKPDLEFLDKYATVHSINHLKLYKFEKSFAVDTNGEVEITEADFQASLKGYYKDDFKEKQLIIKELLQDYDFDREKLNFLLDGILDKFCGQNKMGNGKYFWYSW